MKKKTEILRDIRPENYGFKMKDVTVAAIIKSYLMQMTEDAAIEQLGRIVDPGVQDMCGVKGQNPFLVQQSVFNRTELIRLIDSAAVQARAAAMEWKAGEGEKILNEVIEYIQNDVLPNLSGKNYVAAMPMEMVEFIKDCWLSIARVNVPV